MHAPDIIAALADAKSHGTVALGPDGLTMATSPAALIGALGVPADAGAALVSTVRALPMTAERAAYARGTHDLCRLLAGAD